jgi:hypothetical protein
MAWLQGEELDLVEILEDVGDGRNFKDVTEYAKPCPTMCMLPKISREAAQVSVGRV